MYVEADRRQVDFKSNKTKEDFVDPCYRAPPGRSRVHEGGFPPSILFSQLVDFYVKIIPKTRHRSHTYWGGGGEGCNGSRGIAAIEPAP